MPPLSYFFWFAMFVWLIVGPGYGFVVEAPQPQDHRRGKSTGIHSIRTGRVADILDGTVRSIMERAINELRIKLRNYEEGEATWSAEGNTAQAAICKESAESIRAAIAKLES